MEAAVNVKNSTRPQSPPVPVSTYNGGDNDGGNFMDHIGMAADTETRMPNSPTTTASHSRRLRLSNGNGNGKARTSPTSTGNHVAHETSVATASTSTSTKTATDKDAVSSVAAIKNMFESKNKTTIHRNNVLTSPTRKANAGTGSGSGSGLASSSSTTTTSSSSSNRQHLHQHLSNSNDNLILKMPSKVQPERFENNSNRGCPTSPSRSSKRQLRYNQVDNFDFNSNTNKNNTNNYSSDGTMYDHTGLQGKKVVIQVKQQQQQQQQQQQRHDNDEFYINIGNDNDNTTPTKLLSTSTSSSSLSERRRKMAMAKKHARSTTTTSNTTSNTTNTNTILINANNNNNNNNDDDDDDDDQKYPKSPRRRKFESHKEYMKQRRSTSTPTNQNGTFAIPSIGKISTLPFSNRLDTTSSIHTKTSTSKAAMGTTTLSRPTTASTTATVSTTSLTMTNTFETFDSDPNLFQPILDDNLHQQQQQQQQQQHQQQQQQQHQQQHRKRGPGGTGVGGNERSIAPIQELKTEISFPTIISPHSGGSGGSGGGKYDNNDINKNHHWDEGFTTTQIGSRGTSHKNTTAKKTNRRNDPDSLPHYDNNPISSIDRHPSKSLSVSPRQNKNHHHHHHPNNVEEEPPQYFAPRRKVQPTGNTWDDDDDETQFNSVTDVSERRRGGGGGWTTTTSAAANTATVTSHLDAIAIHSPIHPLQSNALSTKSDRGETASFFTGTGADFRLASPGSNSMHNDDDDDSYNGSVGNRSWTGRMRANQTNKHGGGSISVTDGGGGNRQYLMKNNDPPTRRDVFSNEERTASHYFNASKLLSTKNIRDSDASKGVEEIKKIAKEDPATAAVGVGICGAFCGAMVFGPPGFIVAGAAGAAFYGVSQLPDHKKTKMKEKASTAVEKIKIQTEVASDYMYNNCNMGCGTANAASSAQTPTTENDTRSLLGESIVPESEIVEGQKKYSPQHNAIVAGPIGGGNHHDFPIKDGNALLVKASQRKLNRMVPACCRMSRITPVNQIHSLDPSLHPRAWLDVMASAWTTRDEKNEAMEEILLLAKDKNIARMMLEEGILDSLMYILYRYFQSYTDFSGPKALQIENYMADPNYFHSKLAANCCVALAKAHCVGTGNNEVIRDDLAQIGGLSLPVQRQVAQLIYEVPHHVAIKVLDTSTDGAEKRESFKLTTDLTMEKAEALASSITAVTAGKIDINMNII